MEKNNDVSYSTDYPDNWSKLRFTPKQLNFLLKVGFRFNSAINQFAWGFQEGEKVYLYALEDWEKTGPRVAVYYKHINMKRRDDLLSMASYLTEVLQKL